MEGGKELLAALYVLRTFVLKNKKIKNPSKCEVHDKMDARVKCPAALRLPT